MGREQTELNETLTDGRGGVARSLCAFCTTTLHCCAEAGREPPSAETPRVGPSLKHRDSLTRSLVITASCSRRYHETMCYSAVNRYSILSPGRPQFLFLLPFFIQFAAPSLRPARTSGRSGVSLQPLAFGCVLPVTLLWKQAFTGSVHLCSRDCWSCQEGTKQELGMFPSREDSSIGSERQLKHLFLEEPGRRRAEAGQMPLGGGAVLETSPGLCPTEGLADRSAPW